MGLESTLILSKSWEKLDNSRHGAARSYLFSQSPSGPRSLIRLGRWRWPSRHKACLAPGSPGRGSSRRCWEWTDEENINRVRGKVLGYNFIQSKQNIIRLVEQSVFFSMGLIVKLCVIYWQCKHLGHSCFSLTYWNSGTPFFVQPMRYRATSGAPWSQVALKVVMVASDNRRFFGAGTTSAGGGGGELVMITVSPHPLCHHCITLDIFVCLSVCLYVANISRELQLALTQPRQTAHSKQAGSERTLH